jgi:hypothetical protein
VRTRDLEPVPPIPMESAPRALVSTPSGDRIFAAGDAPEVAVVDRYRGRVAETIQLPGPARSLRMDPLGRYLLAQPEHGDFAWVIAVGTSRLLGAARTRWLPDLPQVTPDGTLLLAQGGDVVLADAETLRERARVKDGVADFWSVVVWNGFRPRAPGLDEPVRFAGADSVPADSTDSTRVDSASTDTADAPAAPSGEPGDDGYVVSFASFPSESRAREIASAIKVRGESPRVVPARVGVTTVYRVVLGPYASRTEAERVGRESGHTYWVFEATP